MPLITNLRSEFENLQIQYGGSNMAAPILAEKSTKNKTISNEFLSSLTSYWGVFDVAEHESEVRIWISEFLNSDFCFGISDLEIPRVTS